MQTLQVYPICAVLRIQEHCGSSQESTLDFQTSKHIPMYCLAPSLLLLLSRTISKSHNNAGWPPCVGQQKTQNRISYSRWAFNNACQVGRSWKGQPNLIHPISERDETDKWYTPAAFQCHFPNEKKKRKEWDISAFL